MPPKRKVEVEDLLRLKALDDPQMSPDGRKVVFTVQTVDPDKNRYLAHLWMGNVETGAVQQFTHGPVYDTAPRWSPDGHRIAFLRNQDGASHLWMIAAGGGEAYRLDSLSEGAIGAPHWSPGGDKIAFTFRPTHPDWTQDARQKRAARGLTDPPRVITRLRYKAEGLGFLDLREHIWVCDAETGEARQLTGGEFDDSDPTWSPDGGWIAFLSNRSDDPDMEPHKTNLWLVPVAGGAPVEIPLPFGHKRNLSWSPDGRHIAYIGCETTEDPWTAHNDRQWVIPVNPPAAGMARCLTAGLDRFVGLATIADVGLTAETAQNPIWFGDSSRLFFLLSDRGNAHVYTVGLDDGTEPEAVVSGTLNVQAFSADSRGEVFALLISRPTVPAEICLARHSTWSDLTQLSRMNAHVLDELSLSEPEECWFESSDGLDIQGWLLKPPDFDPRQKYPSLLYVHGGPDNQYGNTFFHEFQVLAARGMVVFYANPRGSMGRGEHFATSIQGNWGSVDYQDLMAAADYAASLPYVNPERMAVAGGSYGGYMVAWIIARTDRFCCAIAERGSYNEHSGMGTSDWPPLEDGYWPGNTWDRPERLWEQSPLRYAANIHTPLLLIHSEGDWRCPIGQAEELFTALKWLKREVVFVRYPQETNHELTWSGPPDLRVDRLHRVADWLAQHLRIEPRG